MLVGQQLIQFFAQDREMFEDYVPSDFVVNPVVVMDKCISKTGDFLLIANLRRDIGRQLLEARHRLADDFELSLHR